MSAAGPRPAGAARDLVAVDAGCKTDHIHEPARPAGGCSQAGRFQHDPADPAHAIPVQVNRNGVRGILVRPLSAKLLEPTIPEKEGIIDREKLLDIKGRGRKPQMALAEKFGIKKYPQPSGGCLLTDPGYAKRVAKELGAA